MKIGVNTRFLLPKTHLEGIGKYTFEILSQLCKQHPEDTFYFFFDRPYDPRFVFSDNIVPIVLFPPARHPILFTIWFEWSVRRALKKYDIDVFLSFDGLSTVLGKTPEVLVVHDIVYAHTPSYLPGFIRWYLCTIMPPLLKKAKRIVAVSEFVKNDICQHYQLSPAKVDVAYNALPSAFHDITAAEQRPLEDPYFIVPGAIIERKNTLNILKAFVAFKERCGGNNKLVFAGRFMFKPSSEVKTLWDKLQGMGELIHLNKPTDQQMVQWVRHSSALVYASLFEGFGIPILEGMASSVPVITSNVTSMPEVAGDAAISIDPHDPAAISEAMEYVLDDENKAALVSKGPAQLKKFNWPASAAVVYRSLVLASGK